MTPHAPKQSTPIRSRKRKRLNADVQAPNDTSQECMEASETCVEGSEAENLVLPATPAQDAGDATDPLEVSIDYGIHSPLPLACITPQRMVRSLMHRFHTYNNTLFPNRLMTNQ